MDLDKHDPFFVDQAWLDAHPNAGSDYALKDLTDKGVMFLILFQTWAYMQIFAIFNARRPSYKDINPFQGLSVLTCVIILLLLGFQFSLCYIPMIFGYGTMGSLVNLLCMAMGACSIVWFTFWKAVMLFIVGREDEYPEQA